MPWTSQMHWQSGYSGAHALNIFVDEFNGPLDRKYLAWNDNVEKLLEDKDTSNDK